MKISVVIPVLNDAALLERCLRSLAEQTRLPDEIIVVDNGCTDTSVAVAIRAGATVITESRPGITAASAAGFDRAAGDVIARCDADSILPADWLARISELLGTDATSVAVSGPGHFYDLSRWGNGLARVFYMAAYFRLMRLAVGNNVLFGSNCAVRATAWRAVSADVPRDDTELHDDIDLSFRIAPWARILHDPDLVVGISGRPFRDARGARRRMHRALHTLRVHWPDNSPRKRWRARLLHWFFGSGRRYRLGAPH